MKSIAVTGLGAVSAIGLNTSEHLNSLIQMKTGIAPLTRLRSKLAGLLPAGEIKLSDEELSAILKRGTSPVTRSSLLGMMAASEAIKNSGGNLSEPIRTGLISSTTVGGMTATEKYYYSFYEDETSRIWIDKLDCGDSTQDIADYLGHTGYMTTISTACSSSANAIILGANLIKAGKLDRAICGGTDALSKFTFNGFHSLMLLEKEWCRPFDKNRTGLNLGEGAGYVVLENAESAARAGHKILARLSGYANVNDAFHQTASSPDGKGAMSAMQNALRMAGIQPGQVDYINVHGTGTPNNDESESMAMQILFGNSPPPFSSTKAFTGHTLAAAGGIEAVFSVLALQNKCIWPNLNFKEPMEQFPFRPETELLQNRNLTHVLSNSFGFGGNNSSLLFSSANSA